MLRIQFEYPKWILHFGTNENVSTSDIRDSLNSNIWQQSIYLFSDILHREKTDLLAATALATVLGMAMGLSELELLMDLSHPDLLLRAPDLVSPPGGPDMQSIRSESREILMYLNLYIKGFYSAHLLDTSTAGSEE